jgi:hypothetical protein
MPQVRTDFPCDVNPEKSLLLDALVRQKYRKRCALAKNSGAPVYAHDYVPRTTRPQPRAPATPPGLGGPDQLQRTEPV